MMAPATLSLLSTHATASCAGGQVELLSDRQETLHRLEDRVVQEALDHVGAALLVPGARPPSGAGAPGLYLPVRMPWATGDQTTWETPPSSREVGTTRSSITRHSIEYCGWFDTSWMPSSRAS